MLNCPYCHCEIILQTLKYQGMFKRHRRCPQCGGAFGVDASTRRRQAALVVVALILLGFTWLLLDRGIVWLVPTIFMSLLLIGLAVRVARRMSLVAAGDRQARQG